MIWSSKPRHRTRTYLVGAVDLSKADLGGVLDRTQRLPEALLRRYTRHPYPASQTTAAVERALSAPCRPLPLPDLHHNPPPSHLLHALIPNPLQKLPQAPRGRKNLPILLPNPRSRGNSMYITMQHQKQHKPSYQTLPDFDEPQAPRTAKKKKKNKKKKKEE